MSVLIECIPNFSEGRDGRVIDGLVKTASSAPSVALLDFSADESHNRSVFTLAGSPEGIEQAAFLLAEQAAETINLTKHTGEHPRMGAVDVIPFVPLKNADMDMCVNIAVRLGKRLGRELNIPVFLYEAAAPNPSRRDLAAIRRGGFEGMTDKMKRPEWRPDFGPAAPHPTAGVTAVGARGPLIAFNVNLNTPDVSIAKNIAKIVRASGGGFAACKAIGVLRGGMAQVSVNMTDFEKTPLYRVFETVKMEAARYGVTVAGSEIIGLSPAKALADSAAYYLQLEDFDYKTRVLEHRAAEME